MNKYRTTVMVTLDVEAEHIDESTGVAIRAVQEAIGDTGQIGRTMWVTGICRDQEGDLMVYEQKKMEI